MTDTKPQGPFVILSIDGGGARGVVAANVLYHIEDRMRLGVRDTFDCFAGVSTGAMIAAYCARDVNDMAYLAKVAYSSENLSRIFDKSIWDHLLGRVQNQPKYDGVNKRAYVDSLAGDSRINDITDKYLLILAYDFINRELVTFKNNSGHDAAFNPTLAEVCDAATAAPTLYPTVATSSPKRRWLVDGALATNDPSLCAITEALAMGYSLEDLWVVSIGTGKPVHDLTQHQRDRIGSASRDWGVLGWVKNGLLDHMLSASSCVSAHQCAQLLGERYVRITGELPRKLMQLDNTSATRVADLADYAFEWFEQALPEMEDWTAAVAALRAQQADGSRVGPVPETGASAG